MAYEEEPDLARIREIRNRDVVAWRVAGGHRPETSGDEYAAGYERMWAAADEERKTRLNRRGPAICLGTNHLIGLVPPAARVGDAVVRFWGCDAAVVMRPVVGSDDGQELGFMLVGRADVAEVVDRKATPGRDVHAEQGMSGGSGGRDSGAASSGAVLVDFDLATLQAVTAYIVT